MSRKEEKAENEREDSVTARSNWNLKGGKSNIKGMRKEAVKGSFLILLIAAVFRWSSSHGDNECSYSELLCTLEIRPQVSSCIFLETDVLDWAVYSSYWFTWTLWPYSLIFSSVFSHTSFWIFYQHQDMSAVSVSRTMITHHICLITAPRPKVYKLLKNEGSLGGEKKVTLCLWINLYSANRCYAAVLWAPVCRVWHGRSHGMLLAYSYSTC